MTYDAQKVKFGRQLIYVLEIDVPKCTLTYGNTPCTASGGVGAECFNTYGTCQDTPNFTSGTKTYRFTNIRVDNLQGAGDAPTFPTLMNVNTSPTTLTPGKGLGVRSTLSVTLTDHPWTDVAVDPYYATRSYDPDAQGTFWGKFLARNQYYENKVVRLKTGYLEDDGTYNAANMITRTYFIESISGPDEGGKVNIKAKDILKFADREKAQLPTQSRAVLRTDITASETTLTVDDPGGSLQAYFDAGQKYIRMDDEIMFMDAIVAAGTVYTVTVTRASRPGIYSDPSVAVAHEANETVQQCYFFDDQQIDDIVYYLLNTVAGINSSYLPTADWQTKIDYGLQSYKFSALITEPTAVKDLLDELTEHTILIWWDERAQEVKMDTLVPRLKDYGPFTDANSIIADSTAVARDDKSRVSQVWFSYGLRYPTLPMDEHKNFNTVNVTVDTDAENANAYDQKKIRKIWSRWVPRTYEAVAGEITNRLVNYYSDTKKVLTLTMDPKDDDAWTGDIISASTRLVQNEFGASPTLEYRVLQVAEKLGEDAKYDYVIQTENDSIDRFGMIGPNTLNDYGSESAANIAAYAFIAANSAPYFADSTEAYKII